MTFRVRYIIFAFILAVSARADAQFLVPPPGNDDLLTLRLTGLDTTGFPDIVIRTKLFRGQRVVRDTAFTSILVTENGTAQNAEIYCPSNPITTVLVMDKSLSMAFIPNTNTVDPDSNRWRNTKSALHSFIEQIEDIDRCALVSFARNPTVDQDLTNNKQLLHDALEGVTLTSSTGIWKASVTAINMLKGISGDKIIILLTDGEDNASGSTTSNTVIAQANAAGIRIYTVGLGEEVSRQLLSDVATRTGGRFYFSATGSDLTNIYYEISAQLAADCIIRYRATNFCPDGILRHVVVDGIYENVPVGSDTVYTAPFNVPQLHLAFPPQLVTGSRSELRVPLLLPDSLVPGEPLSFTAVLSYPVDMLSFIGVATEGFALDGYAVNVTDAVGSLTISLDTADVPTGMRGTLLELVFEAKSLPAARSGSLVWGASSLKRLCAVSLLTAGETVFVDGECDKLIMRSDGQLFPNYPNPVATVTRIPFEVRGQAAEAAPHTRLRVLNAMGDTVAELVSAPLSPGLYGIDWDASSLPSGAYTIELRSGEHAEVRPVLIVR